MRMWMVDPKTMCNKHLLGEHVETHMFLGTLKKRISVAGYLENNLFEPLSLKARHDALATEMAARGMNHNSPLDVTMPDLITLTKAEMDTRVDVAAAADDLHYRCRDCWERSKSSKQQLTRRNG